MNWNKKSIIVVLLLVVSLIYKMLLICLRRGMCGGTQFSAVDDTLKNANCECLLGKVCHIGRFCQVFDICLLGCIILMRIIYGKKSKSNIGTADNILSLALHY